MPLATNKPVKLTINSVTSSARDGSLAFIIKVGSNTVDKASLYPIKSDERLAILGHCKDRQIRYLLANHLRQELSAKVSKSITLTEVTAIETVILSSLMATVCAQLGFPLELEEWMRTRAAKRDNIPVQLPLDFSWHFEVPSALRPDFD